jgi:hypothetical protein
VYVYALDRNEAGIGKNPDGYRDLHEFAKENDGIPVTSILLHDVTLSDVLATMKTGHLHFRSVGHKEHPLIESRRADHPPQEIGEA